MDYIVPIILVSVGALGAGGEPLRDAMQRRSVYGVYADDFADEYEPVAVAAFPLHQPLSVVRLLTPSALSASLSAPVPASAPAHKRAVPRAQPPRDHYAYAASEPEWTYSYEYDQPEYAPAPSNSQSKYAKYSSYESQEYDAPAPAPVIVYARPNKSGGYTYRRQPARPAAKPQEPVIIRVHKYKVVRD